MHKPAFSWLTLWASLLFATILGFSRLSYGLFLPAIRQTMGGTYGELGMLGTLNFVGYFLGTLFLPVVLRRSPVSKAKLNWVASVLLGATLMGSGLSSNLIQLGIWRLLIGLFSAVSTVLVLSLTLDSVQPNQRGTASGVIWMGGAAGIVVSGFVAPFIMSSGNVTAWRWAWIVMGVFGVLSTLGFEILHKKAPKMHRSANPSADAQPDKRNMTYATVFSPKKLLFLSLSYFLYGWSYIVYFTYLVPYLVSHGLPSMFAGIVWSAIGLAGMLGGLIAGKAIDIWQSGFTLAISLIVGTVGTTCVLMNYVPITIIGGITIGIATFLSPPIMTSALLRRELSAAVYPHVLSTFSALFALGQVIGPLVGGWVVDHVSLQIGIASSAITMFLATIFAAAYGLKQRQSAQDGAPVAAQL